MNIPMKHLLTNSETQQILQWQRDMLDQPVTEKILIYQPLLFDIQCVLNHAMERYRQMDEEVKRELEGYVSNLVSVNPFDETIEADFSEQTQIYKNISLLLDKEEKKFQLVKEKRREEGCHI
ncbi:MULTISPECIES: hypothetical protein [Bacillati]|uniref:Uncharacterized protein n=1 Tax=Cytobacillus horneckiae TaxID=549687 RepID=A0A2N0Z9B2_9BACI|nr:MULTISPECIES: hypothetical protein [Terrabacteria group]MDK7667359.1 hypothetical protein [Cytobacillus oceanisediminis]MEC1157789.1 hypothetical protein [Cytobacillus horneckiae]PKG26079.1 hypothetical protein CWS20_25905 [Cytobacillus horneckiae]SGI88242.1 Uncharacterised protein [Mycobacterium tuberculosis]